MIVVKKSFLFPLPSRLIQTAGAFAVMSATLTGCAAQTAVTKSAALSTAPTQFDFGTATTAPGYVMVNADTRFSPDKGYGWLDTADLAARDRKKPDDLNGDFVFGKGAQTFRIAGLKPGRYLLKISAGDQEYGDHVTRVQVAGADEVPLLSPQTAEFQTLAATINTNGTLDIRFSSPNDNWIVSALSIEPATAEIKPVVTSKIGESAPIKSEWNASVFQNDPTAPLLAAFRANSKNAPKSFAPTGLSRATYLKLISGEIDFWKTHQNASGAIIDPYSKKEVQYSTPAFANAAAVLVARDGRADLLEPACRALDWATQSLGTRRAADGHEDFYPTMIAHAYILLKPVATPTRVAAWDKNIRGFNPYNTYRQAMGSMNWNVVSSAGEFLFQNLGLRDQNQRYVADSLAAQGRHFTSPFGLYLEGPLAYDHFPRLFLADMLAQGYDGPYSQELGEALNRAALASLWMQSPSGELPAGGRSAQHQWNEAQQCVTYEIYAAKALAAGDAQMVGVYKRAAHLALASMKRWVRPSGEMQIVKNWIDPAKRYGFESYSAHSQYNLLPMAMLANAYERAATTETIAEKPAPADVGGFAFEVAGLHKIFANAGGTYVEIDSAADSHYDATGLIRVHIKGVSPQLGPSDSLLAHASYNSPGAAPQTMGVGVAWQSADGKWQTLGETKPEKATIEIKAQTPARVAFDVTYQGGLAGVTSVVEHYVLTPGRVELTSEVPGYSGALRYMWPVLADDGKTKSTINVNGNTVSVSQNGGVAQTFAARGASSVSVGAPLYSNHNGWARVAVAQYANGSNAMLVIAPQSAP